MREFTLNIPGDPVAKGRPRVYGHHGITPKKTVLAENRIYTAFTNKYPDFKPLECDVQIKAVLYMSRRGKPDVDNCLKLILDSLNGVAYRDDSQIVHVDVWKIMPDRMMPGAKYGTKRRRKTGDPLTRLGRIYEPHTEIHITPVNDEWQPAIHHIKGAQS